MKCSLCGKEIEGFGNNPEPLAESDEERCCDECNGMYVLPMRIYMLAHELEYSEIIKTIEAIRKENHNER